MRQALPRPLPRCLPLLALPPSPISRYLSRPVLPVLPVLLLLLLSAPVARAQEGDLPDPTMPMSRDLTFNPHAESVPWDRADPSTGIPCPHSSRTGNPQAGSDTLASSSGGCNQREKDESAMARNIRLRGYVSGTWDSPTMRERRGHKKSSGRVVDGGPDCKTCVKVLEGANILESGDDDSLDRMRGAFMKWSTDAYNVAQQMSDDASPTAKHHNYDVRQCYEAFETVRCSMEEK